MDKYYLALQLNDSAFPLGAYSHSFGLETYVQKELVYDEKTAEQFVRNKLDYSFQYYDILCARLSYIYTKEKNINKLMTLEQILNAARLPVEVKNASRKMGMRFIKTIRQAEILNMSSSFFEEYLNKCEQSGYSHCIAYGMISFMAGIPEDDMLRNYIYSLTSAMVMNCVKLIPLSQNSGQRILSRCHNLMVEIGAHVKELSIEDIAISTPGFDIRCMEHETLYSRLYMS